MLLSRVVHVVAWAGICLLTGCAVGSPGDIPCTTDVDCPAGKDCDAERLICVQASIATNSVANSNNRVVPNSTPNNTVDMGNNGTPNNGTPNNTNTTNTNNTNTNTTNTNNTGACTPMCHAPETCVNGTCVPPALADCAAAGDACDPSRPSQGGFTCLDVDGDGLCARPCDRPQTSADCPAGEFCVTYDGNDVCLPSLCATSADCDANGTCIEADNGFFFCIDGGALAPGANCSSADDQCPVGEVCDPSTSACEPLCDPWASAPCSGTHYCEPWVTARTGLCTHDDDSTAPNGPFQECLDAGTACDDAVECFALDATLSACLKYCRPGMNDCSGVLTGQLDPTVCDPYKLFEPGLGLCWPPCTAGSCATGYTCVNELCRASCTPGNEVADCCGGQTPCPAYCNPANNLCE